MTSALNEYSIRFYFIHKAPAEIVSLFSGSRQVVYGFVENCTMVSQEGRFPRLTLFLGDFESRNRRKRSLHDGFDIRTQHDYRKSREKIVFFKKLYLSSWQILHQLTARALIRDWEEGSLSADRMEHEVKINK